MIFGLCGFLAVSAVWLCVDSGSAYEKMKQNQLIRPYVFFNTAKNHSYDATKKKQNKENDF